MFRTIIDCPNADTEITSPAAGRYSNELDQGVEDVLEPILAVSSAESCVEQPGVLMRHEAGMADDRITRRSRGSCSLFRFRTAIATAVASTPIASPSVAEG